MRVNVSRIWHDSARACSRHRLINLPPAGLLTLASDRSTTHLATHKLLSPRDFSLNRLFRPDIFFGSSTQAEGRALNGEPGINLPTHLTDVLFAPLPESRDAGKVILRDYQTKIIEACLDGLRKGITRMGISSPTGSGKTVPPRQEEATDEQIGELDTVRHGGSIAEGRGQRGQALILVGKVELVNQAEAAARRILEHDWSIEVEQAERRASGQADVTIATYSTLCRSDRLAKYDPNNFKLVIVDEAHHAAAQSYLRILHYFNRSVQLPPRVQAFPNPSGDPQMPIIGFCATFSTADNLALSAVFEEVIFHMDPQQLIACGPLSPLIMTVAKTDLDLDGVMLDKDGEYRVDSVASRMVKNQLTEVIVRAYRERAEQRRSTVVFCLNLRHVQTVTAAFRKANVDARWITFATNTSQRSSIISSFGKGEFPVLVNCELLTEGTDIPEIDCIILARPTLNENLIMQMLGRGLRKSPHTGKKNCLAIDIEGSVARANGRCVIPNLMGLAPEGRIDSPNATGVPATNAYPGAINHICSDRRPKGRQKGCHVYRPSRSFLNDDLFSAGTPASLQQCLGCLRLREVLLICVAGGHIAVATNPDKALWKYTITYRNAAQEWAKSQGLKEPPYGDPELVGFADDLRIAIQTGDTSAKEKFGDDLYKHGSKKVDIVLRCSMDAPWRKKPASENVLRFLMMLRGEGDPDSLVDPNGDSRIIKLSNIEVRLYELKSGQVADMIMALKHGSKPVNTATISAENEAAAEKATELEGVKDETDEADEPASSLTSLARSW